MREFMLFYMAISVIFISNVNLSEARYEWGQLSTHSTKSLVAICQNSICNRSRNNIIRESLDVLYPFDVSTMLRGGASDDEDESSLDDEDSDESVSDSDDETEVDQYSEEEEYDECNEEGTSLLGEYDEPLVPNQMSSMMTVIGAMMVFRRFDMYDPQVVRNARIAFVAYISSVIAFSMYVRFKARSNNDQRPVVMENAIAGIVKSQINNAMAGSSSSETVKSLADKFLTSVTNIMEYDMQQASALRNSVLAPMLILWVLHFKMNQVQPLLMQIVTGLSNLMYHPLVQVYVMGRNLERPFKKPLSPMEQSLQERASSGDESTAEEGENSNIKVASDENYNKEDEDNAEEIETEFESDDEVSSSDDEVEEEIV